MSAIVHLNDKVLELYSELKLIRDSIKMMFTNKQINKQDASKLFPNSVPFTVL